MAPIHAKPSYILAPLSPHPTHRPLSNPCPGPSPDPHHDHSPHPWRRDGYVRRSQHGGLGAVGSTGTCMGCVGLGFGRTRQGGRGTGWEYGPGTRIWAAHARWGGERKVHHEGPNDVIGG